MQQQSAMSHTHLTALQRISTVLRHVVVDNVSSASLIAENCAEDRLVSERKQCSFVVRELTNFLNGGEEATRLKEKASEIIVQDTLLHDNYSIYDMTRQQRRERTMAKIKRYIELKVPADLRLAIFSMMSHQDPGFGMRLGVHSVLFASAVLNQGNEEQVKKYKEAIENFQILGCFSMTELGNGSLIQNFETVAEYDETKQQFVIHSPTITSLKWWIGMAAQSATHTVVYARLVIKGKDYGVHTFIVPLRDINGRVRENIQIGDVGDKMGRNGLDNGWIQFNHVTIPRENMLAKWSQVEPDGTYTPPPIPQLAYGSLIFGRVVMAVLCSETLKRALTIAVRYSARRTHLVTTTNNANNNTSSSSGSNSSDNSNDRGKQQRQQQQQHHQDILSYQSQQYRLLPILAACYAFHFVGQKLQADYVRITDELSQFNLSNLPDFHATSAGIKAFATWFALDAIETCRQCCGGHGYSSYVGLSSVFADFGVLVTGEGENTMIAHSQTARYLIKSLQKVQRNPSVKLGTSVEYLRTATKPLAPIRISSIEDVMRSEVQLEMCRQIAVYTVTTTLKRLESYNNNSDNSNSNNRNNSTFGASAWNECMVDLVMCAKVHSYFFMIQTFDQAINTIHQQQQQLVMVLRQLCSLFALHFIEQHLALLLEGQGISPVHAPFIRQAIRQLLHLLRPNCVGLVDAFNLPDWLVFSPLGEYSDNNNNNNNNNNNSNSKNNGTMYDKYLATVKSSPQGVSPPPYWDALIRPLLNPQFFE